MSGQPSGSWRIAGTILTTLLFILGGAGASAGAGVAAAAVSPVANLVAHPHSGQTFLTWSEDATVTGEGYNVYRSSAPITAATLGNASLLTSRWGPLADDTSHNYLAGERSPATFVIEDLAPALGDGTGLFVHTSHSPAGPAFYAVTTVIAGVENRTVTPGRNATSVAVAEAPGATAPILVSVQNGGLGRVYTQFMDYAQWNPTRQGYAYNYAVGLPQGYDPTRAYPIKVELHAYSGRYRPLPEAEYGWPAIHLLPDDPDITLPAAVGSGHTWWYGFAADHDYRTAAVPTAGRVANFTEYRVMKAIDEVAALFRTDPGRTHVFGHSMGASGALSLGVRYGAVLSAVYASEPMTNYRTSPTFVAEWEQLWGPQASNLPIVNIGPHAEIWSRFGFGGSDQTGVWDWQDHQSQLRRTGGAGSAYLMFAHGKEDRTIDWQTQGRPMVRALTEAKVAFSAELVGGADHTWLGFAGANHEMASQGYTDLGDFILDRGPMPAIGQATGAGPLDPPLAGTDRYNADISWGTASRPLGTVPVDLPDRYQGTLASTSGSANVRPSLRSGMFARSSIVSMST